jgi:hypothetical protein
MACKLKKSSKPNVDFEGESGKQVQLVAFQLILPNVCYPVPEEGWDGTTSETPASYTT